jgi:sugar phosphate isomerase/epimerase
VKFGVAGDITVAEVAGTCGYDYVELTVPYLLRPRESDQDFVASLARLRATGMPCPVVNVFLPADLKVVGPAVDSTAVEDYITTALRRAESAGVQQIVFGSGDAREVPPGYSLDNGLEQLKDLCAWMGPLAEAHGVTIVLEPLSRAETNLINTVGQAADVVRAVDHTNIRLLVDAYHWGTDSDTEESVVDNAALLAHAQVATVPDRVPPRPGDECLPFFNALRSAGYDGRLSVEGFIEDPAGQLPGALEIMRAHTR